MASAILNGIHRQGVHNTIPSAKPHQMYTSVIRIYEKNSDKPAGGGGDSRDLQQRQGRCQQHPPSEDNAAQDGGGRDKWQMEKKRIAVNAPRGIAYALTAHGGGVTSRHLTGGRMVSRDGRDDDKEKK